jgi:hypothetical protein
VTDSEWRVCNCPSRMRKSIRGRSFPGVRWVRFELACLSRVRDLLDDPQSSLCIDRVEQWADGPETHRCGPRGWDWSAQLGDVARALSRRDSLRGAKEAALRALLFLGSGTLGSSDLVCVAAGRRAGQPNLEAAYRAERAAHADLLRCLFRSTLNMVTFDLAWRTSTVVALARGMYESNDFSPMPILGDALQDAGCDSDDVLDHCRAVVTHTRGCWVVDLAIGKA